MITSHHPDASLRNTSAISARWKESSSARRAEYRKAATAEPCDVLGLAGGDSEVTMVDFFNPCAATVEGWAGAGAALVVAFAAVVSASLLVVSGTVLLLLARGDISAAMSGSDILLDVAVFCAKAEPEAGLAPRETLACVSTSTKLLGSNAAHRLPDAS